MIAHKFAAAVVELTTIVGNCPDWSMGMGCQHIAGHSPLYTEFWVTGGHYCRSFCDPEESYAQKWWGHSSILGKPSFHFFSPPHCSVLAAVLARPSKFSSAAKSLLSWHQLWKVTPNIYVLPQDAPLVTNLRNTDLRGSLTKAELFEFRLPTGINIIFILTRKHINGGIHKLWPGWNTQHWPQNIFSS